MLRINCGGEGIGIGEGRKGPIRKLPKYSGEGVKHVENMDQENSNGSGETCCDFLHTVFCR